MRAPAKVRAFLSGLRRRRSVRYTTVALTLFVAILAASVVSSLVIDLGPGVRRFAEDAASRQLDRPVRIGGLSLKVLFGRVVVEDFEIAGRRPGDRPFFTAKRLDVALDWSTALRRRPEFTITEVEMVDWNMLVEEWPDGHSFPRLRRNDDDDDEPDGPRRFTTTLKYLRAWQGQFAYQDHRTPWGVVAPNIDITITNVMGQYRGRATFHGGEVAIQDHVPMWTTMDARFRIDGSRLQMEQIDIETDGAKSIARGQVNVARWPEMVYDVESRVHFPRMREIFFRNEPWKLSGDGLFTGKFLLFKGGHDLSGRFTSDVAGVYDYRFPRLAGSLHWTRKLFEVTDAEADLYGGRARFDFSIAPLGAPQRPTARFNASYEDVNLAALTDFYELQGVRFAGRATGRNLLQWTLGRFSENEGDGHLTIVPPPGAETMPDSLDAARLADANHMRHEWGPFAPLPLPQHIPIAGDLTYRYRPGVVDVEAGRFVTEKTHVTFSGTTAWGDDARFRFHVTSGDWQESQLVLAGILTDFGSRTGPVAFGGRGEFDGTLVGPFRRPRVEGTFTGEDMRAWDTLWGDGRAEIVVENNYVMVTAGHIRHGESEIRAEGLFSLGYPRRDGGEELDARFRVTRRDLDSLRHAFEIDDYPVTGRLTGDFHLAGHYQAPIGFGAMTIEDGVAYGEPFERGTSTLRFDGLGVRLDNVQLAKADGAMSGSAFVGWDSTYSFTANARDIPVSRVAAFSYPGLNASGTLAFTAGGSGTFEVPRWDVRFRIADLFAGEESVGQVSGTLALRGEDLSGDVDVVSPRLSVSGTGRIALTAEMGADLTFRFHESSLDPYVRLYVPRLSPFTTAVASGSIRVTGELADVDRMLVDATVDTAEIRLFDYVVRNEAPIRLAFDRHVVRVDDMRFVGEDTRLRVGGTVSLHDQRIAVRADGDANLGILQGFFRNVRGSGRAALAAAIDGPLYEPVFSGSATIQNGRVRHFSLPNALDAINGAIRFDARGIRLDDVSATMGGGQVQFGGRIDFDGYMPGELNVSARGEGMQLRYPEGVRSTVDADLTVRGNMQAPTLGGTVTVRNAAWTRRVDPTGGLLDFSGGSPSTGPGPAATPAVPLRFDINVLVPSTLRVENNLARLVASADLQLRGTYERPLLFGRAEVDRGEVIFEGRRYLVTRGSIEFTNPTRIEPFFDVEAETRVRVPGQTYRVVVSAAGTMDRMQPDFSSDPPLPAGDVLALLFSDVRRSEDVELRARLDPNERPRDILTTRATQLLANPIAAEVGRVVEETFGVDTFRLSPSLFDPYSQSSSARASINPSARVTIGKRISERVYLTFSRSLSTSRNDQILLLEYDESDRLSWILSRNEDNTYAIEVRVRRTF